jgi:nitroimidazol reductase NimA-like FMN-containing flavoprotein (pyridoxamine 5'-phosphate oxidase superfamily)
MKIQTVMRRKEREIKDITAIEEILRCATVCRLGLCEDNRPYVVPVCFGYKENALYIHCGPEGKKLEIIRNNNNVCFEVDIDEGPIKAARPCDWEMKYKSVIGFGKAVLVEDAEDKRKALDVIMQQFSANTFEYPEEAVQKTTIIKVEIETMTGKQSGY